MMEPAKLKPSHDGCKEMLLSKLVYAVMCSVFSQVIFLIMFLVIVNFNILHPILWMKELFETLTSVNTWLNLIPLSTIIFAQGAICSKDYIYEATLRPTRFLRFLNLFSVRFLFMLLLNVLTGGLLAWLYLSFLSNEYGTIHKTCKRNKVCLVEETFFLLLNGVWIGLFYFVKDYMYGQKMILFPIIHQSKLVKIKSNCGQKLLQAMKEATWPTIYFFTIYLYRGVTFRDWIIETFNLTLPDENTFNIFAPQPLLYSWLLSTIFIFSILCMKLLFEVFLTEHWQFPIEPKYTNVLTLKESLAMKEYPIVQHLACLDLYMLSLWDAGRRKEIFTLSLPGGHPHNWNELLQEVLKIISEYTFVLNKCVDALLSPESIPKPKEIPIQDEIFVSPNITKINQSLTSPKSPYALRNMSLPRSDHSQVIEVKYNDYISNSYQYVKSLVANKINQLIMSIQKKTVIRYLFGGAAESHISYLLSSGQPVVLSLQGISLLASASFREDTYGVVQKDLPVIITTLIQFKQSLDKLNKVTISRKSSSSDQLKLQLKNSLRTAVKRSLYNICNTFSDYISQIQLSKDIQSQVQAFVAFREG